MKLLKTFLLGLALTCTGAFAQTSRTADYPSKPISLIVPFAPGGFVHIVALLYSESMSAILGQPVVVVNRPGANGNVAAESVAKAEPDGYTIFLPTASILTINPHLYKNIGFNALGDFVPVGQIANTSNLFVVSPGSGIKSFKDLVNHAKAGTASFGSSGNGSIQHISGMALQQQANVRLNHIPYKGIGPAAVDVMGDRLTFLFGDASVIPNVKAGRLVAIAASPRRLADLPDVPALSEVVAEAGVPGYAPPAIWYGIVAPKGTPSQIVAKLNDAMAQTLKKDSVREKLIAAGANPADNTSSEAFGRVIAADHARYAAMLKTLNITVD